MNQVQSFEFTPGLRLRAVEIDGAPWFVAADVCKVLGHQNVTRDVARHVDPEDKRTVSVGLRGKAPTAVNESGLYCLVFGSTKPVARTFRRWVTSEVLPAIR
ncbi:BRO-N domain-containing protein [Cupriavidus sp. H39]|uniref:BRO-N domain-containing protein n=1 Tax=Cupriavidus sp. H39 TaxID=3401635 RepID=UPI003CFE2027